MNNNKIVDCIELLDLGFAITLPSGIMDKLVAHQVLIREWNEFASLVSARDIDRLDEHCVDCLTLLPYLAHPSELRATLLDVGAGAGFPSVVIGLAAPSLNVVAIERSDKKAVFLRKVAIQLKVSNLQILRGEFPAAQPPVSSNWVTARAIETPASFFESLLPVLHQGAKFLCQSPEIEAFQSEALEIQRIEDIFSSNGMRRGQLSVVRAR